MYSMYIYFAHMWKQCKRVKWVSFNMQNVTTDAFIFQEHMHAYTHMKHTQQLFWKRSCTVHVLWAKLGSNKPTTTHWTESQHKHERDNIMIPVFSCYIVYIHYVMSESSIALFLLPFPPDEIQRINANSFQKMMASSHNCIITYRQSFLVKNTHNSLRILYATS